MSDTKQNQPNDPLFGDQSLAITARQDAAAVARATQEIQAALVIGQRFPRDEIKAKARIIEACKRKELAELAEYEYSRGGTRITGPTIDLLRAIANRWGNIRFGWEETERRPGESTVRCQAWDTQSNGHAFRSFVVKHWRDTRDGGYEVEDERDIYEMIANVAARRVRACLEEVIDADVVTSAVEQCRRTLREGEKTPLRDRAVQMVTAFMEFGVTQDRIEKRLGNKLDSVSENQLASLRRVYKGLKDGVGQVDDYFKPETAAPKFEQKPTAGASDRQGGQQASDEEAEAAAGLAPSTAKSAAEVVPGVMPKVQTVTEQAEKEAPLKLLRHGLKAAKIKEGVLLGYLTEIGLSDGSSATLEELMLAPGGAAAIQKVLDNWQDFSQKIIQATKA
jgi:hypothetical protein